MSFIALIHIVCCLKIYLGPTWVLFSFWGCFKTNVITVVIVITYNVIVIDYHPCFKQKYTSIFYIAKEFCMVLNNRTELWFYDHHSIYCENFKDLNDTTFLSSKRYCCLFAFGFETCVWWTCIISWAMWTLNNSLSSLIKLLFS